MFKTSTKGLAVDLSCRHAVPISVWVHARKLRLAGDNFPIHILRI